jgi:hypothetical protein
VGGKSDQPRPSLEEAHDLSVMLGNARTRGSLRSEDVEATPLSTPTDRLSEVGIERDDHKVIDECVIDHDRIVFGREPCVAGAGDDVATALKEQGYRLDHVLVG